MLTLYGLSYSPWTEKARWALDHHSVMYRYHEHLVMLEELYLCWKFHRFGGVTVPALWSEENGKTVRLMDSWDIASYSDTRAKERPLFPQQHINRIKEFNDLSEQALDAGRALLIDRMKCNKAARLEALPKIIPPWLRPSLDPIAQLGMNFVRLSFGSDKKPLAQHREKFVSLLNKLREGLRQSKGPYLLKEFTYADITMAVVLHGVKPPENRFVRFGPATRQAWGDLSLQKDYADLLEWRDSLYAKHRSHGKIST